MIQSWSRSLDHMVRNYHYLGYHKMIGPRIKYLACYRDVPIAADGLPEECWYFADIHSPTLAWKDRPEVALPEYSGRGFRPTKLKPSFPPIPVSQIATDETIPWERVILAEGAKDPIVADVKVLRVIECRDDPPGNDVWLYIRRYRDGKLKFSLGNAPSSFYYRFN